MACFADALVVTEKMESSFQSPLDAALPSSGAVPLPGPSPHGCLPSRPSSCCLSLLWPLGPISLPVPEQQQAVVCQHLCARHSSHSGPQAQPDKSIWEAAAPLAAGLAMAFWTGAQS